jgi:hypothetical protein
MTYLTAAARARLLLMLVTLPLVTQLLLPVVMLVRATVMSVQSVVVRVSCCSVTAALGPSTWGVWG